MSSLKMNQVLMRLDGGAEQCLEAALKDDGYSVTTVPVMIGQSGSWCYTTSFALAQIGIEHGPANKIVSKLHEHSVSDIAQNSYT